MTVSVVHADTGSTGQEWRPLLWLAPLTALWIVLIYRQPIIQTSGVPTTLTVHGFIALGLWLGLERTDLMPGQRRTTWLAVMIPYTLWFAVAWSAAINGAFRTGTAFPALPLAIWLPVMNGAPLLLLSKRVGQCSMRCHRPGSSLFSFTAYSAAGLSLQDCVGCCPACSRGRQELAMC